MKIYSKPENKLPAQKERFLIFASKTDFIEEVLEIRGVLDIPKQGFSKQKAAEWQMDYMEKHGEQYENLILKLLKEFRIHPRWKDAIEHFLLTNKSDNSLLPKNLSWALEEVDGSWELKVSIFPGFVPKNIEEVWPELKEQLRLSGYPVTAKESAENRVMIAGRAGYSELKNYKKFKSYTEFENYRKVFKLHEGGKSYKEIAVEMGWKKDYSKVGTYLAKFKEALKQANLY